MRRRCHTLRSSSLDGAGGTGRGSKTLEIMTYRGRSETCYIVGTGSDYAKASSYMQKKAFSMHEMTGVNT